MAGLAKARLQRITPDENETPDGDPIDVQFNPNALRLALTNSSDSGKSAGRQRAQYLGTGSATLTLELVFDTADEGTTDEAKSVLDKTTPIEQLLLPQGATQEKQSPAKVRFEWGSFVLSGLVESMSLDLELFSDSGVPLRAKIGLSIKQQRTDFEFLKAGPGANAPGNAVAPGKAGLGAVGGIGLGLSAGLSAGLGVGAGLGLSLGGSLSLSASASAGVRTTAALEGESAAELAARVGVDPAAWRAIAAGQSDGGSTSLAGSSLALAAGTSVDFPVGISAGTGLGAQVGVQAQASASLDESFGLAGPAAGAATAALVAPGFTLAAAGGVQAAQDTVDTVRSERAASQARAAFGSPALSAPSANGLANPQGLASLPAATAAACAAGPAASSVAPRPERPEQSRRPLYLTGFSSPSAPPAPAPTPPSPDPRAMTFGLGVPLRPRLGGAASDRTAALGGAARPSARATGTGADPNRPSWEAPAGGTGAPRNGSSGRAPTGGAGCGCSGSKAP